MLNRQDQRVLPAAEGERRIHPGKEIARTAQAQPTGGRAILAGMMDDNDRHVVSALQGAQVAENRGHLARDRKSTRLNSSHQIISYAVFCLKKKKNKAQNK